MKIIISVLLLMVSFTSQRSFANDGFAALGVGGVTIAKTDKIAIKNEILDISCDKIKVNYEFINESDRDESALIMFPLPPYPASPHESGIISHGQPSGFSIKVNGKSVTYDTEVKATLKGRDVTKELKSAGLSIKQIARFPFDINKDHEFELKMSKSQVDTLAKNGLIDTVHRIPLWDTNVTYVWQQKFPAKTIINVEHMYHPFSGGGSDGGYTPYRDVSEFCLNDQQINELKNLYSKKKNLDSWGQVSGTIVKYILTTANSWKDGIRDFKLRVHTKSKDEIVSLCFPSKINKVSDTLYETHVENFKPNTELSVYFGNAKACGSNGYGEPPHFR